MKLEDLEYLCTTIGNLSTIPIRIYKNENLIFDYSIISLPKDPIIPYVKEILKIKDHVGYFITPRFHYYGIVNSDLYKIVLGPSRQWSADINDLNELAFECDVKSEDKENFVQGMENLVTIPLNSILQTLCSINFIVNNEKLTLSDITIYDNEQLKLSEEINNREANKVYEETDINDRYIADVNKTFQIEQTLLNYVRHGEVAPLKEWLKIAPVAYSGKMSPDVLRQLKNTFIVTCTLVSRAAIQGGMDINNALALSDAYIQKCELLTSFETIQNLQYHMVFDYTERVEKLRLGKNPSKLLLDIANYVQKHLSEPVDIDGLAKSMFMSRTYLATKFKKETGTTLSDFILKEKIDEAKRLLRYSDKQVSSIAMYLGFSSQSHFANTFKKYTKLTPNEYRLKHSKYCKSYRTF